MASRVGPCGDGLTYQFDDESTSALTIMYDGVGTGVMNDYNLTDNQAPWQDFKNSFTSLVLNEGITYIGSYTFDHLLNIESGTTLSFPTTLKEIGDDAFIFSFRFQTLQFNNGLEKIGARAFQYSIGLSGKLTIPGSVKEIGDYAFDSCVSNDGVEFFEGLQKIGNYAFSNDSTMVGALVLPNSLHSIGNGAFTGCTGFTSLTLGSGLVEISPSAFAGCFGIVGKLTIPNNISLIGTSAFEGCSGITEIDIDPNENLVVQGFAFKNCTGIVGKMVIPDYLNRVSVGLFQGCTGLTGLELNENVTEIGDYAFDGCSGIAGQLTIPQGCTVIGEYAFQGCSKITKIDIGVGLDKLGTSAFQGCIAVAECEFHGQLPSLGDGSMAFGTSETQANVTLKTKDNWGQIAVVPPITNQYTVFTFRDIRNGQCGDGLYYEYDVVGGSLELFYDGIGTGVMYDFSQSPSTNPAPWRADAEYLTHLILPDGIKTIGDFAFYQCPNLSGNVRLPSGLTSIGRYAFQGCSQLGGSLTIPDSVETIKGTAFQGCTGLTGLTLGSGLKSIGASAFGGLSNLIGPLMLPNGLESIGDGAFQGCTGLTGQLTIPDTVTTITQNAFKGCTGFTSLVLPNNESFTAISHSVFYGCSGLTGQLTIPSSVVSIGNGSFRGCSGIAGQLTIPANVTSITDSAFAECSSITAVAFNNEMTSISIGAFQGCSGLKSIVSWSKGMTTIGNNAFKDCIALESIAIPESVRIIGTSAFQGCIAVAGQITFPSAMESIGANAFQGCYGFNGGTITFNSQPQLGGDSFSLGIIDHEVNATIVAGSWATEQTIPHNQYTHLTFDTPISEGICGDGLRYSYATDTHILNITFDGVGTGAMYDYDDQNPAPWYIERGLLNTLNLPEGMTTIGNNAFKDCVFTSISIPTTVRSIGANAFKNCSAMNGNLIIPDVVESIGASAFEGCTGLTGILAMPLAMTSISDNAFKGCYGFTSLVIQNGTTTIGANAFQGCYGFNGLTIPNSVNDIREYAFEGCYGLNDKTIVFAGNQPKLGGMSFSLGTEQHPVNATISSSGWASEEVFSRTVRGQYTEFFFYIPVKTGQCGDNLHYEHNLNTSTLTITYDGVGSADMWDFNDGTHGSPGWDGDKGYIVNLVLNERITKIGANAFKNCDQLAGTVRCINVTAIGDYAFYNCSKINGISFQSVTTIGSHAFYGCSSIANIFEGQSVVTLGDYAFYNCSKIIGAVFDKNIVSMGSHAFYGCSSIEKVILGNTTEIPDYAFYDCGGLIGIDMRQVTTIGASAFKGCSNLAEVQLDAVIEVGRNAFDNCSSAKVLTFGNNLQSLREYAFKGCYGLNGQTITFNGTTEPKLTAECLALGTAQNPVEVHLTGPEWVREEIFTQEVGGPYTKFLFDSPHDDYLCFVPTESGCSVSFETTGSKVDLTHLKYSFDKETWTAWSYSDVGIPYESTILDENGKEVKVQRTINKRGTAISVPMGSILYVWNQNDQLSLATADNDRFAFVIKGRMEAHGNVMSMLNYTSLKDYCFNRLFLNCTTLLTMPELPATTLTQYCYQMLCQGCTALTVPSNIPATTLAVSSCSRMFYNCSSLKVEENGSGTPFFTCPDEIPSYAVNDMFAGTAGPFIGTPTAGNSYGTMQQHITGQCGDNLYYDYDTTEKSLSFNGSGAMWDFDPNEVPWKNYLDEIESVEMVEGMTTIGVWAFARLSKPQSILIPSTVETIGTQAFWQSGITSVNIASGSALTNIRNNAFDGCVNLTTINLPDGLFNIGYWAFHGAGLTSIAFPSSVAVIDYSAFENCVNLTSVVFASDVKCEHSVFKGCTGLRTVDILPLSYIPENAFEKTGLTNIVFGNIANIGANAFKDSKLSGKLIFPESIQFVDSFAFSGCTGYNNGSFVFLSKSKFKIANDGFSIGTDANAVQVNVSGADWVKEGAFTQEELGNYTTFLYEEPTFFEGPCGDGLTYHYDIKVGTFTITWDGQGSGIMTNYNQGSAPWYQHKDYLKSILLPAVGMNTVGEYAFYGCNAFKGSVMIPNVKEIGEGAFEGCSGLTSVSIAGAKKIGNYAFRGCTGLTGTLNLAVNEIGSYAFDGCSQLTGLNLMDGIGTINAYAFRGCTGLKNSLTFPDSLSNINDSVFEGCYGLDGSIITWLGDEPTLLGKMSFSLGTEQHPVKAVVVSNGWASDEIFTDAVKGSYTAFEYREFPKPDKSAKIIYDGSASANIFVPIYIQLDGEGDTVIKVPNFKIRAIVSTIGVNGGAVSKMGFTDGVLEVVYSGEIHITVVGESATSPN